MYGGLNPLFACKKNKSVALQALMNLGPAEQPPLADFPNRTRRYWVDMWSAHRIPQSLNSCHKLLVLSVLKSVHLSI
jgi:hypothetical protein